MDEYKINQIKDYMKQLEIEIAQEKDVDVTEVQDILENKIEIRDMLSNMETISFEEWCNKWRKKDYYPSGPWKNTFRIYVFKVFLGKSSVYFNIHVSLVDDKHTEELVAKLREMEKIDIKEDSDKNCSSVIGIFDILYEGKIKDIIEDFCKKYPDAVKHIQYCHT